MIELEKLESQLADFDFNEDDLYDHLGKFSDLCSFSDEAIRLSSFLFYGGDEIEKSSALWEFLRAITISPWFIGRDDFLRSVEIDPTIKPSDVEGAIDIFQSTGKKKYKIVPIGDHDHS